MNTRRDFLAGVGATALVAAFREEGADAWYSSPPSRFLGNDRDPANYEQVMDIVDVWFESGSTHAFVLEDPVHFPGLAGIKRKVDGGADTVMYLEGSDQHRGWFHSSLLESCGTRGRALAIFPGHRTSIARAVKRRC